MSPTPTPTVLVPGCAQPSAATTASSVATASPVPAAPPPASGSSAADAFPWVLVAAIVAATVTAGLAVWTARRKSREEERSRQRMLFAEAFQAYAAYKEMPYAIRRRRHDDLPGERVRLSEVTREIQSKLSYHETWIAAESTTVGSAYSRLVSELRKVAGGAMREAWTAPPITTDDQMNMPPTIIDLSPLAPLEKTFVDAVHTHLDRLAPWWRGTADHPSIPRGIRTVRRTIAPHEATAEQ